MLYFEGLEEDY